MYRAQTETGPGAWGSSMPATTLIVITTERRVESSQLQDHAITHLFIHSHSKKEGTRDYHNQKINTTSVSKAQRVCLFSVCLFGAN